MKNKKRFLVRCLFVVVLLCIGGLMLIVGRGHTIYFDNKALEYNGQTYTAPYKVVVYEKGAQAVKLYDRARGTQTHIGQVFSASIGITQEKGGSEQIIEFKQKLPYNMDGVIINIPGYLAGLPEDAYLSEFISEVPEEDPGEEPPGGGDEPVLDDNL